MAKTWYSVMNSEHILPHSDGAIIRAGTVFVVEKLLPGARGANALVSCQEVYGKQTVYFFPASFCKAMMSKPTLDFSAVMEYSIMQCEAAYC